MTRIYYKLFVCIAGLMFLLVGVNAKAQGQDTTSTTTTTTETPEGGSVTKVVETTNRAIVTPVPAAKEVIATPEGYVSCFYVQAGWFNNLWVPTHRVCQYNNTGEGVVWIEGYWGCNKSKEDVCTNWEWRSGHWQKSLVVY